ncbi:MAG: DUF4214 domain-containing protein [Acidimicrobiia bacterium]
MLRRIPAVLAALALMLLAAAVLVDPAGAADDVRAITFPVDGPTTYTDTYGECRSGCTRRHAGIDLMTDKHVPLLAAADATVTAIKGTATPDGREGNYLVLTDAQGWEYWYVHVNNDSPGTDDGANPDGHVFGPGIERGATVRAGQLVAYAGDSGNAEGTAPHLHFEIHRPDGSTINPFRSLQEAQRPSSPQYVTKPADERFVRALALDFLDRAATDDEVRRDAGRLAAGSSRSTVVGGYAGSDEWVSALVTGYYEATLGRTPDEDGLDYWVTRIQAGTTPAAVAAHFYGSPEHHANAGGTDDAWVTDLYEEILGRTPDEAGLDHWVGEAERGVPLPRIAGAFHGSLESRRTRVTGLYAELLARQPDEGGLAHWAERLRDGRDVQLAVSLAVSDEYHARAQQRPETAG